MFVLLPILLQSCKASIGFQSVGKKDGLIYHDSTAVVVASRQVSANVTPSGSGEAEILTPSLFQWPAVSNRVVAAGISDPGIGEDITGRMAIIRAMVVAGLLNNSTVQNVTETYYRQLPGQKLSTASFNSLSKIVSVVRFDTAAILISEQQITGAGEKIVLITADSSLFAPSLYCDRVEINAEVFYSETPLTLGDRIYMYFKIKAVKKTSGGESIPLFNWELHSDNNRIEFRSEFEGKEVYFPIRYRRYEAPWAFQAQESPDPDIFLGFTMGYGIWNAFAVSLLRQIDMLDKENLEVKSMMDDYSGRFEIMSREVSVAKGSHGIHSAVTCENRYYLRIDQLTQ